MDSERILKRLRLFRDVPRYYLKAATEHGLHPLGAARALYAAFQESYWPDEAYGLGLLLPGADARTTPRFMSKARMVALQRTINPAGWEYVLSDKGIFARYTIAAGLPIPRFLAWSFRNGVGSTPDGRSFTTPQEWCRFLEEETPEEFVLKPARSAYGSSVHLYQRNGKTFSRFDGRRMTAQDLYAAMCGGSGFSSMVLQERVRNHPDLVRLSGAEGLQTVRIVSVVGRDGVVYMVNAFFKPIVGRNEVDNFRHGSLGNLLAPVRFEDGALADAVAFAPRGGIQEIPNHPETGMAFRGFRLPFWEEACALVRRTALVFLPVRLIGFDVALSPAGPVLIEGNFWPDPPQLTWDLGDVVATLEKAMGDDLGHRRKK
jgi:hypothetical protein